MNSKLILEEALHLRPTERLQLIQQLTKSLDVSDENIDEIWAKESEKRYKAFKEGKVKAVAIKEIITRYKSK